MYGKLNRIGQAFKNNRNKIFWALFIIIVAVFIISIIWRVFFLDIVLGIAIILIGLERIEEEFIKRETQKRIRKLDIDIDYLFSWLKKKHGIDQRKDEKHDYRFFNLDKKRNDLEMDSEIKYRDSIKKIIELENKMNEIKKILLEKNVRSGRDRKLKK